MSAFADAFREEVARQIYRCHYVTQHLYGQDIALYAYSVHRRSTIVLDDGK